MISVSAIFCLKCGAALVDINGWDHPGRAIIECAECGNTTTLNGFSLGRTHISADPFINAADDVAVYSRNPVTRKMIMDKAKEEVEYDKRASE